MSERAPGAKLLAAVLWGASALALFAGVATLRAVLDGERELALSDAAFDANDLHGAIQHARRAASAYAPCAPHVQRGYDRLLAVARHERRRGGDQREEQGDREGAPSPHARRRPPPAVRRWVPGCVLGGAVGAPGWLRDGSASREAC